MTEKITLSGVPETMPQIVYACARESEGRGTIHDPKAEEIIRRLDYDFPWRTAKPRCAAAPSPARLCSTGWRAVGLRSIRRCRCQPRLRSGYPVLPGGRVRALV